MALPQDVTGHIYYAEIIITEMKPFGYSLIALVTSQIACFFMFTALRHEKSIKRVLYFYAECGIIADKAEAAAFFESNYCLMVFVL